MLALTLTSMRRWRASGFGLTLMTRTDVPLALLAATFDYLETLRIGLMLHGGADPALVQVASTATMVKSALTTAALLAVVAVVDALASVLLRRMSRQRA